MCFGIRKDEATDFNWRSLEIFDRVHRRKTTDYLPLDGYQLGGAAQPDFSQPVCHDWLSLGDLRESGFLPDTYKKVKHELLFC